MNKYERWYHDICSRGVQKRNDRYTERHHIIPESFFKNRSRPGKKGWLDGDPDARSNITHLTGKEHAIAHHLLTKIYHDDKRAYPKVIRALEMMSVVNQNQDEKRYKLIPRVYERAREERAKIQSEEMSGENNPQWGREWTEEEKDHNRQKLLGRKPTQEELDNHRAALDDRKAKGLKRKGYSDEYKQERSERYAGDGNPMFGKNHKESTLDLMAKKATGRVQSEVTKRKIGNSVRGSKRDKILCVWCDYECAVNTYPRFHGHNCKCNPHSDRYDSSKNNKELKIVVDFLNWVC